MRVAFTTRKGGMNEEPYSGLNLGSHVGDNPDHVLRNRDLVQEVLSGGTIKELITLNQVHGKNVVTLETAMPQDIMRIREECAEGADGIVIDACNVAALLCFADCMPIIMVSPTGAFAVVHAGWRGVMARIAQPALDALLRTSGAQVSARDINVYIGPYIHAECFEVSHEISQQFENAFGSDVCTAPRHIDLGYAVKKTLNDLGVEANRIADVSYCTVCANELFYSYRAEQGVCGRHGAIAFRQERNGACGGSKTA